MNPLVILGSSRKESDTRKLVNTIFEGIDHTVIDLLDLKIQGYDYGHAYGKEDQYSLVVDALITHRQIVFATPVYWYAMSSIMKTVFDRFSDLSTYRKSVGRQLKGKLTYLVAVGAEEILPEGYEVPFRETSTYLDMQYMGYIYHCTMNSVPVAQSIEDFRRLLSVS